MQLESTVYKERLEAKGCALLWGGKQAGRSGIKFACGHVKEVKIQTRWFKDVDPIYCADCNKGDYHEAKADAGVKRTLDLLSKLDAGLLQTPIAQIKETYLNGTPHFRAEFKVGLVCTCGKLYERPLKNLLRRIEKGSVTCRGCTIAGSKQEASNDKMMERIRERFQGLSAKLVTTEYPGGNLSPIQFECASCSEVAETTWWELNRTSARCTEQYCRPCYVALKVPRGEEHPDFNEDLHKEKGRSRDDRFWGALVVALSGNKCALTGQATRLTAHHIKPHAVYPDDALDCDNGVALARDEHLRFHQQYEDVCEETLTEFLGRPYVRGRVHVEILPKGPISGRDLVDRKRSAWEQGRFWLPIYSHEGLHPDKQAIINTLVDWNSWREKIPARKTAVVPIEVGKSKKARGLLAMHRQGIGTSGKGLGLLYNGVLVMVATFGKSRFRNNSDMELYRMVTAPGFVVVGGASKLIQHYRRANPTKSLHTYADRRWSDFNPLNTVYDKGAGGRYVGNTMFGYVWADGTRVLRRQATQKHKLFALFGEPPAEDDTEVSFMERQGFWKVEDMGNFIFEWPAITETSDKPLS